MVFPDKLSDQKRNDRIYNDIVKEPSVWAHFSLEFPVRFHGIVDHLDLFFCPYTA